MLMYISVHNLVVHVIYMLMYISVHTHVVHVINDYRFHDFLLQVGDVLTAMKLPQYIETFAEEQISGELLLELTDDMLEQELFVTSKLHRMRIMKLIYGVYSAQGFLNGEGPYVSLIK